MVNKKKKSEVYGLCLAVVENDKGSGISCSIRQPLAEGYCTIAPIKGLSVKLIMNTDEPGTRRRLQLS